MTTICAISDLHLDQRSNGVPRFEEIARALRQARDEAIARKVDLFCVPGDLGDPDAGPIVYRLLAVCAEVMGDLDACGIPQIWVKGNHDGDENQSLLTPLKAIMRDKLGNVAETAEYYGYQGQDGVTFDLLALPHSKYDPVKAVQDFIAWKAPKSPTGREKLSVVVSHLFPIVGIEPGEETNEMQRGGPRPLPCEMLAEIPGPVLVISGHYHRRQIFQPKVPGCPPVFVVGSACQLTHGEESNSPGFLIIEA